jgi:hypothetical protein
MSSESEWTVIAQDGGERVDIVTEAQEMLTGLGYAVERREADLYLPDSGLTFSPRGISFSQSDNGSIRTVSIVRAAHPKLLPAGIFEFQHGSGDHPREALQYGLNQWARLDVPVLCGAVLETQDTCTVMEMTFPPEDGRPERKRRVILGPTAHVMSSRPENTGADACGEEHSFCPCCLTTQCGDVFLPLFKAEETFGVRLFAMRNEAGEVGADCRINGEEYEPGKEALREYARSWPQHGFEFRKQYVLYQSLPLPL